MEITSETFQISDFERLLGFYGNQAAMLILGTVFSNPSIPRL
jgi:hypothetical protein